MHRGALCGGGGDVPHTHLCRSGRLWPCSAPGRAPLFPRPLSHLEVGRQAASRAARENDVRGLVHACSGDGPRPSCCQSQAVYPPFAPFSPRLALPLFDNTNPVPTLCLQQIFKDGREDGAAAKVEGLAFVGKGLLQLPGEGPAVAVADEDGVPGGKVGVERRVAADDAVARAVARCGVAPAAVEQKGAAVR